MHLIANGGMVSLNPGNTMDSIMLTKYISYVDGVKLDVFKTIDNYFVLSDNDEIPRLINGSNVKEKDLLRKLDVIIADTAEDDTVGKVVQIGDVSIQLVSGLHTVACRPNYRTADGFLGYYMNSMKYLVKSRFEIISLRYTKIQEKEWEKLCNKYQESRKSINRDLEEIHEIKNL